jgi:hypothetical protein
LSARGAALAALVAALTFPAGASASTAISKSAELKPAAERQSTYWAHPAQRTPIRKKPAARSQSIVSTHMQTEDGFSEVYLVIRSRADSDGHTWLEVRIPMRPNGKTGWVRESAMGPLYRVGTRLVVDRSDLRASLYKHGRKIWSAPVGIGKSSTPTPEGHFWIREKFKASGGVYGPRAFGTSDYSVLSDWPGGGVIGIHGTDEPGLIPGRPSHGCIRLKNDDVLKLYDLMGIGTPVLIK